MAPKNTLVLHIFSLKVKFHSYMLNIKYVSISGEKYLSLKSTLDGLNLSTLPMLLEFNIGLLKPCVITYL